VCDYSPFVRDVAHVQVIRVEIAFDRAESVNVLWPDAFERAKWPEVRLGIEHIAIGPFALMGLLEALAALGAALGRRASLAEHVRASLLDVFYDPMLSAAAWACDLAMRFCVNWAAAHLLVL
jgi:hypothetical protein